MCLASCVLCVSACVCVCVVFVLCVLSVLRRLRQTQTTKCPQGCRRDRRPLETSTHSGKTRNCNETTGTLGHRIPDNA